MNRHQKINKEMVEDNHSEWDNLSLNFLRRFHCVAHEGDIIRYCSSPTANFYFQRLHDWRKVAEQIICYDCQDENKVPVQSVDDVAESTAEKLIKKY